MPVRTVIERGHPMTSDPDPDWYDDRREARKEWAWMLGLLIVVGLLFGFLLGRASGSTEARAGNTPRRWRAASYASRFYGVSTSLLVAIGMEENPSPSRDWFATGCMGRRNRGLHPQFWAAARLCRRVLGRRALSPTFADLQRLNAVYGGDDDWPANVHFYFQHLRPHHRGHRP